MGWLLAIDFGTTYTTAAIADGDLVEMVEIDGGRHMPSAVFLDENGALVVGDEAGRAGRLAPGRAELTPKRHLGEATQLLLGGQPVAVHDAVGAVLRAVYRAAMRLTGDGVADGVVLTHPAGWSEQQLEALIAAARAAGIESPVHLVAEPVAAALHLASRPGARTVPLEGYVAIYDLGGGTFDASVLRRTHEGFEVVGIPQSRAGVAGLDFDDHLFRRATEALALTDARAAEALAGSHERRWRRARAILRDEARHAKERLSVSDSAGLAFPDTIDREERLRVTREELERLLRPAIEQTLEAMGAALASAGVDASKLSALWLAGGSARIPLVSRLLEERFGRRPHTDHDLQSVVALGALRAPNPGPIADDDVRFTVYRPQVVPPDVWRDLLVFAHKSRAVAGPDGQTIDPEEEVRRQADRILGGRVESHRPTSRDSPTEIVRGTDLRFVPAVEGVEFNPASATFRWLEPVHSHVFRFRADGSLDGTTADGWLSVFRGVVLVATVPLALRVESGAPDGPSEPVSAPLFRRVFASYAHDDLDIVARVQEYSKALGDDFIRDETHLRASDVWSDALRDMIRDADVFQLFWSHNAMRSQFVQEEWRFALSLGRPHFVRPVYWEHPLPRDADLGLPPDELLRLHFARLETVSRAPARLEAPAPEAARPDPPRAASSGAEPDVQMPPAQVYDLEKAPPGRRRRTRGVASILAAAATAAVAVVAVTTVLSGGGSSPSASPVRPPTVRTDATVPTVPTRSCTPVSGPLPRGVTSVTRCDVGGMGIRYVRFTDAGLMEQERRRLAAQLEQSGARPVDCQAGARYTAGSLKCFVRGGERLVLWTDQRRLVVSLLSGAGPIQARAIEAWRAARVPP